MKRIIISHLNLMMEWGRSLRIEMRFERFGRVGLRCERSSGRCEGALLWLEAGIAIGTTVSNRREIASFIRTESADLRRINRRVLLTRHERYSSRIIHIPISSRRPFVPPGKFIFHNWNAGSPPLVCRHPNNVQPTRTSHTPFLLFDYRCDFAI